MRKTLIVRTNIALALLAVVLVVANVLAFRFVLDRNLSRIKWIDLTPEELMREYLAEMKRREAQKSEVSTAPQEKP